MPDLSYRAYKKRMTNTYLTGNNGGYLRDADDGKVRPCEGCGNPDPWTRRPKKELLTGRIYEECNRCFDPSIPEFPDVYCPAGGYWDEHLYDFDDPTYDVKKGLFIRSKAHKAYVMKKMGVREAGDVVRGRRNFDPISHKHAMESLRRSHENKRLEQNRIPRSTGTAV